MQDKFVADIGDYAKYALLRALSKGRKLGVAWYLYPHEEDNAGNFIEYLDDPARWRGVDPPLFDSLLDIINKWSSRTGERSVVEIMARGPLLQAAFAHEMLCFHPRTDDEPDRALWRREWFKRVRERLCDCNIVFADPDNGLCENGNFHYNGSGHDWKRMPLCEALQLAQNQRPTVIYHHSRQGASLEQTRENINDWLEQLPPGTFAFLCRRYRPRTFFVLNPDSVMPGLVQFANAWDDLENRLPIRQDQHSEWMPTHPAN